MHEGKMYGLTEYIVHEIHPPAPNKVKRNTLPKLHS